MKDFVSLLRHKQEQKITISLAGGIKVLHSRSTLANQRWTTAGF